VYEHLCTFVAAAVLFVTRHTHRHTHIRWRTLRWFYIHTCAEAVVLPVMKDTHIRWQTLICMTIYMYVFKNSGVACDETRHTHVRWQTLICMMNIDMLVQKQWCCLWWKTHTSDDRL